MLCVVERFLWKKETIYNINECISIYADGQEKSRNSEVFLTQMFYSKKSQFFHRAR